MPRFTYGGGGKAHSVLLVDRSSNHPTAIAAAARGSRGRGPPKARVSAPAHQSPVRGVKEKANERIAAQLAQRAAVPVAEVVHSPSSPDSPLIPPVTAAVLLARVLATLLLGKKIRWMTTMVPTTLPLRAVVGRRQQVRIRPSPPMTIRSRQPTWLVMSASCRGFFSSKTTDTTTCQRHVADTTQTMSAT
jgi:hypothetical protein